MTLLFFLGNALIESHLARGYHAAESAAPDRLVLETIVVKSNVAPPAGCTQFDVLFNTTLGLIIKREHKLIRALASATIRQTEVNRLNLGFTALIFMIQIMFIVLVNRLQANR